jgi:AraC family transcriptional regulator
LYKYVRQTAAMARCCGKVLSWQPGAGSLAPNLAAAPSRTRKYLVPCELVIALLVRSIAPSRQPRWMLANHRTSLMSLNQPAAAIDGGESRWSGAPSWYLWVGGFFAIGRSEGVVPPHWHHAIQVVIAFEGTVGIRGRRGDWRMGNGLVVQPDVEHSFNANGAAAAMFFVDPESLEGVWLRSSLREEITIVPSSRLVACTGELRRFLEQPMESLEVRALIRHCVQALSTGAPPSRQIDPRVTRVLAAICKTDDLRMSVEDAAAMVFLSPSRFAHLFKQQVGLPFRRYMLWRKLARAVLLIGRQGTISTAAHAADFADAAHLTRTFSQMFGIPPSVMMRGEFFEIASPFELPSGQRSIP